MKCRSTACFAIVAALLSVGSVNAQTTKLPAGQEKSIFQKADPEEGEPESIETAQEHAKQQWFREMQKPQADYFKILRKFNRYFKKHPLEGSGPKEYGVSWLKTKLFYLNAKGRVQDPPPANYNRLTRGISVNPPLVTDTMAGDWRMLGPRNSVQVGAGVGNNGGYGYCVRIDPTNPSKLFISFVTGGLWVSADNGNAWHLADVNMPANTYYDIDVCRANNNIVYAVSNTAVIKSTDGGMSWNTTTLNSTNYTGNGYDIAASPTDPNIVVARWGVNIYRTTDGGATWVLIKTGLKNFSVWDSNLNSEVLDWDNSNSKVVYFTDRGDNQNYVDVYKSGDAGLTFSLVNTLTLPSTATGTVTGWSKICTATNDPAAFYVLIGSGTSSYVHTAVQLFKLDTGTAGILLQRINMIAGVNTAYGSPTSLHHGDIAMDIHDENKIVWGSYSQQNAQFSTDNGASFTSSASTVHSDLRSVFMMDGKVILGTDGSTVVSKDGGNNFTIVSNSISNHELWGFGSAFNSDILAAGCNHGPLMLREYEAPGGWYSVLGADQGNSDFNPLDSVTAYSQGYDSYHVTRTGIKTFTNGGQQIDPGGIYSYFNTLQFHPNLYHTLITHHAGGYPASVPQATKNIWKNSLIRSDDNGLTVSVVHTFTNQLFREKVCMSDTSRIYTVVGLTGNNLMKTTDAGLTWTDITPSASVTGTSVRNISDIAVSDMNPNEIWVTYGGVQNTCQVLHSTDGGATYTNLTSATITSNPVTKIIFQRGTNGGIYIGNASGIYYRNNTMSDWTQVGQGLPQMDMRFMFINYAKGKILIGTSRGAWDHDLYEHSQTMAQISAGTDRPNCQAPTVQFRDYSVASAGGSGISYSWSFPGGKPAVSTVQNPLVSYAGDSSGSLHSVSLTIKDQYGTSSQTLTNFIYYDGSNCCQGTPAGWTMTDIGTNQAPGTLCYTANDGNFRLTSNATGLSDPNDNVPFVYQTLNGDGQIIARVKDVSSNWNYGGGIMIRNSLQANSAYVFLNSLDTRGIFDIYRIQDGGNTSYQPVTALSMPMWLKLQRHKNVITSFYSTDGSTWTAYHTYTFPALNTNLYIGLSASGNGCRSDMDSVAIGPLPKFVCNGGSANGCPAYDSIPGRAINFYDYTYFNIPVSTTAANAFTITGWIKPKGILGSQSSILAWDQGYFYMGQNNDNQLEYVWNSPNASNTWNSGLFVPADKWSFVAMVIRPDSAILYMNDHTATDPTPQGVSDVTNGLLGNSNPGSGYFLGQMDELTVWKRALSTHEIDSLRHLTKEKIANKAAAVYDSTLISYFQFNDTLSASSYNQIDSSRFDFGGGAGKIASTAPVGSGISAMQTINNPGHYHFGNTGLTLHFSESDSIPGGNVWVSKINPFPDQYPHAAIMPDGYWIIDNYGTDSSFGPVASLRIDSAFNISSVNTATYHTFRLFKRPADAEGFTWGNAIDKTATGRAGTPGDPNLDFRHVKINSEGQLFVNGGAPAPQADSVAGKMLDLTPAGDSVISLSPIPINSNTFTITMWVKPHGLQHVFSQIISSQAPNTRFGIGFSFPGYTDNLNLVFTNTAINYGQQSNITLLADQWNHVALTYSPDSVSIYLNGGIPWTFPKASSNTPSGFPAVDFSQAPVTVNADIHNQGGNYKGQLDEICFYNYPLSQQEIREKMYLTKTTATETGLVGYYQFNQYDSTTDTLFDAMGNGTASRVAAANITLSTAPVASGTSFRIANVTAPGAYSFTGTGLALQFPGPIMPNGEMVVSRLNSQPDSVPAGYTIINGQYWIIRNWGANASFTPLTTMQFDNLHIPAEDTAWHHGPKLFKRASNEYLDNWAAICGSVIPTAGGKDSVIFGNSCNDTSFSQFLVGILPAPVTLLHFSGEKERDKALLQWEVSSEINLSQYEVQRSKNGRDFTTVGTVKATNLGQYNFTDNQPPAGNQYYRLKIVDDSSQFIYSRVISLGHNDDDGAGSQFIRFTPNPVYSNQVLTVQNLSGAEARINLHYPDGKPFRTYIIGPGATIQISSLPKGLIMYEAINTEGKRTSGVEIVR